MTAAIREPGRAGNEAEEGASRTVSAPIRLAVIVPTLNEAGAIAAALRELQPLRARGHEVIVVDGASHDGTPDLAAGLADRIVPAPRGRASQMNAGARVAGADVLLFLHADTRLPAEADALVTGGLERTGRVWGRFDVRLSGERAALRLVAFMMNQRSRLTGIATGDQAIFVRRAVFEAIGGFPEIPLMEDIAISRRLKRTGRPLCLRPAVVTSSRRWESAGVARTVLLMWRLRLAYALGMDPARLARLYDGP